MPTDPAASRPREDSPAQGAAGGVDGRGEGGASDAHHADFWEALYSRRSIRRFLPDPVPRELIDRVMHAGTWAPSSCNYQMWDVVAVDDPELNSQLTALSSQMGNAPVNLVVSYARDFSEEGWANVQSASAMIQNMSLAAGVLGLGTFWITQMGDREKLRELVGLPRDRLVVAVLALGVPKVVPAQGPRRRPLSEVTHYNTYAGRAIPSSTDPADWSPELLSLYQRARVLNGLRHNKPREWETRALVTFLDRCLPEAHGAAAGESETIRPWLDVLPCSGILTERLSRERRGFRFDVVERTVEVARFAAGRTRPRGASLAWPEESAAEGFEPPAPEAYDVVSCFFRLEGLQATERAALLSAMARWMKPEGRILLGFVSSRSFHGAMEALRRRRGGPGGVEYVLAPDPNIGPFEALDPRTVEEWVGAAGLRVSERLALGALPCAEEVAFRTRNASPRLSRLARGLAACLAPLGRIGGIEAARGRYRFLVLEH
ncbi:MAG: nitroreductase family protein [Planctomycetota bacterium]|nr:nitroreductase family protein [Planctomycetota bacterium]